MEFNESQDITLKNILNKYNTLNSDEIEEIEEYLFINIYSAS
jgi:hypothetical protein